MIFHEANAQYVITAYSEIAGNHKLHYSMASLDDEIIEYNHLYLNLAYRTQYIPLNYSFSKSFQVFVLRNVSASEFDILIGPVGQKKFIRVLQLSLTRLL